MTPAKAATLNALLAPLWETLRAWTTAALATHRNSRDYLTHEELVPIRRSIALIEGMLRRMVLVAATALAVDITARWSPDRRAPARQTRQDTHTASVQAATLQAESTQDAQEQTPKAPPAKKTFNIFAGLPARRTHAADEPPNPRPSAEAQRAQTDPAPPKDDANTRRPRTNYGNGDIELTPEQFNAWADAQPPVTAAERAETLRRQEQEVTDELERHSQPKAAKDPTREAKPKLERKTVPELVATQAMLARLAWLAECVANPQELIRHAAIALARRREIAYRLSLMEAPKPSGLLAACPELYGTLIPFHAIYQKALCYFALSYTEPDTC